MKLPSFRVPFFSLSAFTGEKALAFIDVLSKAFNVLPHLPMKISRVLAKIMPWLALIGIVLGIVFSPIMGILSLLSLITLEWDLIATLFVSTIILVLNSAMLIKSFNPLRRLEYLGWVYLFWANVFGLITTGWNVWTGDQPLVRSLISAVINVYLLFEIKRVFDANRSVDGGTKAAESVKSDAPATLPNASSVSPMAFMRKME
jgi:hypothetical protein